MSFIKYFKLSSYCLIASGFVAIAATGGLDVFSMILFALALGVSWFIDTERLRARITTRWMNFLAFIYFPVYCLDYLALSQSFIVSTVRLIFFMAALKLMTRSNDRDYVYLYMISFAELLAASTLTIDMTFALSFVVFLVSAVTTLVLFEMRRSNARAQRDGKIQPLVVPGKSQGAGLQLFSLFPAGSVSCITAIMTLVILILAVPIFLLMPRIAVGLYSRPTPNTQFISGFSEQVSLGDIGNIKESDTVVMRVKLDGASAKIPYNLKWRGIALDYYDGRSWRRSNLARKHLPAQGSYFKLEDSIQGTEILLQTFLIEALSTDAVFACQKILAVSSDLRVLQRDAFANLFTAPHRFHRIRYTAVSDLTQPNPLLIPATPTPIPNDMRVIYLQLPTLDPRITDLANDVTQSIPSSYGKAQALEAFLKNNYGYSLALKGTPHGKDPIATFLFDSLKGHCEYFASAMTIMLRQLGIPARLVNGFRTGEYNGFGDAWVVRQYDAHSWVEVYFPPYGWIEFDPTPPDPDRTKPAVLKMISNLLDAVDMWWTEEVVNYTFLTQYRLMLGARLQVVRVWENIRLFYRRFYSRTRSWMDGLDIRNLISSHGLALTVLTIVAGGIFFLVARYRSIWRSWILRSVRRTVLRGNTSLAITILYKEALDLLQSHGLARALSQTPREFAEGLKSDPVSAPFAALTDTYYRLRYGTADQIDDLSRAEALLESLKRNLRMP